jgi:holliday junction DNA helicase RuvB
MNPRRIHLDVEGHAVSATVSDDATTLSFSLNDRTYRIPNRAYTGTIRLRVHPQNPVTDFARRMGVRLKPEPVTTPAVVPPRVSRVVRPQSMATMVGQDALRLSLMAHVRGALVLGEPVGDVLLTGPSGLGKTSLAGLIAYETGGQLATTEADALSTPAVLANELLALTDHDVLLIDECHGLTKKVMRTLLTVLETRTVEVTAGTGARAGTETRDLAPFTLVCATTDPGELSEPFRARFALTGALDYYSLDELTRVVTAAALANRSASGAPAPIRLDPDAAVELARRGRGTPRKVIELLHAVHRFAAAAAKTADVVVDRAALACLALRGIDERGLTTTDRAVLRTICTTHRGGPVGSEHLVASLGIAQRELRQVIEPFLIRSGLYVRTPGGRMVTDEGYRAVELEPRVTAPHASDVL